MAQTATLQLLPQTPFTGNNLIVVGDKQPAASYYISGNNLQTVSYSVTSMTGVINIQASLSTDPTNGDWFIVGSIPFTNATQTGYINIDGSYVWIRTRVNSFTQGIVNSVKLSY